MGKNTAKNKALLIELETYLGGYGEVIKEAIFKDIMDTDRRFRADYYIPSINCIVEVNGGQLISGRHNRGGKGYENDLTKLNIAANNGIKVFQFTYEMLENLDYKNYL